MGYSLAIDVSDATDVSRIRKPLAHTSTDISLEFCAERLDQPRPETRFSGA